LDKFKAESAIVEQTLLQIEQLVPADLTTPGPALAQSRPELYHKLVDKVERGADSAQKALELERLLRQNSVKVEENQLSSIENKLLTLRRQLGVQKQVTHIG
jgi:hypothetical protein